MAEDKKYRALQKEQSQLWAAESKQDKDIEKEKLEKEKQKKMNYSVYLKNQINDGERTKNEEQYEMNPRELAINRKKLTQLGVFQQIPATHPPDSLSTHTLTTRKPSALTHNPHVLP